MKQTVAVNAHYEKADIMVDRSSVFGNPFYKGKDGTLDEVLELYEIHLRHLLATGVITKWDLRRLKGKRLGCWCKPRRCHVDIIIKLILEYFPN